MCTLHPFADSLQVVNKIVVLGCFGLSQILDTSTRLLLKIMPPPPQKKITLVFNTINDSPSLSDSPSSDCEISSEEELDTPGDNPGDANVSDSSSTAVHESSPPPVVLQKRKRGSKKGKYLVMM